MIYKITIEAVDEETHKVLCTSQAKLIPEAVESCHIDLMTETFRELKERFLPLVDEISHHQVICQCNRNHIREREEQIANLCLSCGLPLSVSIIQSYTPYGYK